MNINVPNHLVVGARTGFLDSMKTHKYSYGQFTTLFDMKSKEQLAVDLGAAPMPKNSATGLTIQQMIEKSITLKTEEWDITVGVHYNDIKDDQTGELESKTGGAGKNFQKHMNKIAFQALNAGDANTWGLCYDGQNFYSASHVDDGANYRTAQDNELATALSLTNFDAGMATASGFLDDMGEPTEYEYDLLVVSPSNRKMAAQIADNKLAEGTSNRDINPYAGQVNYVVSAHLDTAAWMLLATSEGHKPLIMAVRERPHLQHSWFVPDAPKGGLYVFKYYARYDIHFGDWRTALMGQT